MPEVGLMAPRRIRARVKVGRVPWCSSGCDSLGFLRAVFRRMCGVLPVCSSGSGVLVLRMGRAEVAVGAQTRIRAGLARVRRGAGFGPARCRCARVLMCDFLMIPECVQEDHPS